MADNVAITAGSGTDIAADDIASVWYQRVKIGLGADGTAVDAVAGAGAVDTGTQRVTLASDDPAVALLGTMDADTGSMVTLLTQIDGYLDTEVQAIVTAVQLLDNVVSGSGVNVSQFGGVAPDLGSGVVGAGTQRVTLATDVPLPAGTNAIGKLAANAGVTIGAVEIVSDQVVSIMNALPAGDNNIGNVDIVTQPARAATTDTIAAKLATDALHNGTTALTPKFAAVAASSSGDNTLIAAVAGKKIRVLSYTLVAAGAVTARFEDGAGGTPLSGQMSFGANGGASVPFSPLGHFETTANTLLNLELGGAVSVAGHVCYVEV